MATKKSWAELNRERKARKEGRPIKEDPRAPACPKCGRSMCLRTSKAAGTKFWGCQDYPKCNGYRARAVTVYTPGAIHTPEFVEKGLKLALSFTWAEYRYLHMEGNRIRVAVTNWGPKNLAVIWETLEAACLQMDRALPDVRFCHPVQVCE